MISRSLQRILQRSAGICDFLKEGPAQGSKRAECYNYGKTHLLWKFVSILQFRKSAQSDTLNTLKQLFPLTVTLELTTRPNSRSKLQVIENL